jgi:hypothetical protein
MDEIERILSSDEHLTPPPDFTARVLDSVHRAAAEPPPLRFPYGRFGLGVAACGLVAHAATSIVIQTGFQNALADRLAPVGPDIGYAAAALAVGFSPLCVRTVALLRE